MINFKQPLKIQAKLVKLPRLPEFSRMMLPKLNQFWLKLKKMHQLLLPRKPSRLPFLPRSL